MALTIDNPLGEAHLTADVLIAAGERPLIPGDTWALRVQVRRVTTTGTEAVGLTGALAIWTVRQSVTAPVALFVRRSDVMLPDAVTPQIQFDGDQTTENVAAGTGKGWLTLRGSAAGTDPALFLAAVGMQEHDLRIRLSDLTVVTVMRGKLEIPRPVTLTVA